MAQQPRITEGEISLKLVQALYNCLIRHGLIDAHDLETMIAELRANAPQKSASPDGCAADVVTDWLLELEDRPLRRVQSGCSLPLGQNDD